MDFEFPDHIADAMARMLHYENVESDEAFTKKNKKSSSRSKRKDFRADIAKIAAKGTNGRVDKTAAKVDNRGKENEAGQQTEAERQEAERQQREYDIDERNALYTSERLEDLTQEEIDRARNAIIENLNKEKVRSQLSIIVAENGQKGGNDISELLERTLEMMKGNVKHGISFAVEQYNIAVKENVPERVILMRNVMREVIKNYNQERRVFYEQARYEWSGDVVARVNEGRGRGSISQALQRAGFNADTRGDRLLYGWLRTNLNPASGQYGYLNGLQKKHPIVSEIIKELADEKAARGKQPRQLLEHQAEQGQGALSNGQDVQRLVDDNGVDQSSTARRVFDKAVEHIRNAGIDVITDVNEMAKALDMTVKEFMSAWHGEHERYFELAKIMWL